MAQAGSKTEKPTPRRLEKARKEGQFLSSKDFVGAVQFLVFVMLAGSFTRHWMAEAETTTRLVIHQAFERGLNGAEIVYLGTEALSRLLWPLAIGGAVLVTVGLGAQLVITRFGFSLKKLKPSLDRLNPKTRLKELAGRNIPATIQAVLMLVVFGSAIYLVVESNLETFLLLPLMEMTRSLSVVAQSLEDLFWKAAGVFLLFGIVDMLRQHRKRQKELKMTKHEVREEMKESEGDPHIRARIRRLRRDMLQRQMIRDVPTATAVVVNPTHYAVALRYDHGSTDVPLVVAKGRNHLAQRIREVAVAHNVPLIENPPLAQALYKSVKVGQEIPPHLYRAVAEVLAYIYRLMMGASERSLPSG